MTDERIVYVSLTNGGGIDGLDHTDKGGKEMAAALDRYSIPEKYTKTWYHVEPKVVDFDAVMKGIVARLSPTEKLVLKVKCLEKRIFDFI